MHTRSPRPLVSFSAILEKSGSNIWGCHLVVPEEAVRTIERATKRKGGSSRVVCTLNDSLRYQCAVQHYGRGQRVLTVNKDRQRALQIEIGDEVHVQLARDASAYGLPMPEEFTEALAQDAEGSKRFHALTPGIRRTLIYIVGNVKDPEQRIRRATVVLRHLNTSKGSVDYRALYSDLTKRFAHI
jgi:hypothetical protein